MGIQGWDMTARDPGRGGGHLCHLPATLLLLGTRYEVPLTGKLLRSAEISVRREQRWNRVYHQENTLNLNVDLIKLSLELQC